MAKKKVKASPIAEIQEPIVTEDGQTEYSGIPNVETDTEIPPAPETAAPVLVQAVTPPPINTVWDSANKRWCDANELPPAAAPQKRTKVAIVGFASHWTQAPFDNQEFEIWSLNEFYDVAPNQIQPARQQGRLRWFEIHDREMQYAENPFGSRNQNNEHAAKMAALGCPVYMHQHYDDIPGSIAFPKDQMIEHFKTRYFTNSISWMLSLAITEGFTEIRIYGVDMAQSTEYCVAPETRVLTADLLWVPASEVRVGQRLIAFEEFPRTKNDLDGRYRHWKSAIVEEANQLTRPCYRLHMADGTTLVSSVEHRWLVHRCNEHQWAETGKLQSADVYPQRSSKIVKLVDTWEPDTSWEAGYLAAAFDGEGHLSQTPLRNCTTTQFSLGFSQRKNGMSGTVERELRRRGFGFSCHAGKSVSNYRIRGGRPESLRFLGQMRPQRLLEKFDPDAIGITQSLKNVEVLKSEFIGEQPVIGLKTTTGTFIAEGFASHNSSQRPSCEFFIGWAKALGIRVYMPVECDLLLATFLYGFEADKQTEVKAKIIAREQELQRRIDHNANQGRQLEAHQNQLIGAMENTKYIKEILVRP